MPRTKLTDKYSKPKIPPPNYLSEMLKRYKKAYRLSDEYIAQKLGTSRKTVNRHFNQPSGDWNIGELRQYCEIVGAPFEDALMAVAQTGK